MRQPRAFIKTSARQEVCCSVIKDGHLVLGRKLFLLAIALGSIILLCETIIQGDLARAWGTFGVPAMSPTFADMRTITHSIECKENGHNPYLTAECDRGVGATTIHQFGLNSENF
jgi:hypothetical protein